MATHGWLKVWEFNKLLFCKKKKKKKKKKEKKNAEANITKTNDSTVKPHYNESIYSQRCCH